MPELIFLIKQTRSGRDRKSRRSQKQLRDKIVGRDTIRKGSEISKE